MGRGMKEEIHAENSCADFGAAGSVSAQICGGIFFGVFFNRGFARVSPVFAVVAFAASSYFFSANSLLARDHPENSTNAGSAATASRAADPGIAERRQAATSQFARAEDQRAALNLKPTERRTLNDYKQVVTSYRRVYLITPHAPEVPDALVAVAELYTEMGDRFGRMYYQSAVDTYQFLMREYPASKYLQDAYLRSAKLQKDQLGDTGGAIKAYDAFLKKFPHSKNRRGAQEARAELALLQNSAPQESAKNSLGETRRESAQPSVAGREISSAPKQPPRGAVKENAAKESAADETPDAGNESAPAVSGKIPVVRKVSTKSAADSTQVSIDLDSSGVQYISGRVANPDRIYFDLHAARLAPSLVHAKIAPDGLMVNAIRVAQSPSGVVRVVLEVRGVKDYTASLLNNPARLVVDLYADVKAMPTARTTKTENAPGTPPGKSPEVTVVSATPAEKAPPAAAATDTKDDQGAATAAKTSTDPIPQPKSKLGLAKTGKKPDLVQPASSPQPTRDGQSTLTRVLGLKIGRIVVDAGHGGHDTGTIGPTGLMEKDLCLDVALRLGKIIQQRLPGAEVVLTRSDDTFIPLEERTHIANDAKADMFISIHANSSQDAGARGIETYYLNLKGSDEAMEVAARENATSEEGIHELQDLVKQIARTEKIDESREFAGDVQDSLSKRIQKAARPVKNRGVRKAPFVVLIGADMPSILTEISFLSNPADEKLLKQPEHRQRVAEGIFQGIAGYLQSLNSTGVNQNGLPMPKKTTTSAASAVDAGRNRD
jgi:N-acetylmuramoyl-L-alanine amidase